ncbi:MAG: PKD domain-containing protein [Thermoplasmata archaeon]|nr:MAG: PKD domain-containing protein [Thermoplasmata archaeon]
MDGDPFPALDILDPRLINSTYTDRIPIIDGVMEDNEWRVAEGSEALHSQIPPAWEETGTHITGPGIQNDSDASHRFWTMYDEDYLYLGFNCSDDAIWVDNYPTAFWRDDGIEVSIDGALDMDEDQRTDEGFEDGDTFAVPADGREGIAYSIHEGNQYARIWGPNKDWFSAVTQGSVNNQSYYVVEMAIRLNSISNPTPASIIGFNTGQNDDDDGNTTKEGVIRWQGLDGYEVWKNETLWGNLYFTTAVTADAGFNKVINQTDTHTFDGTGSWSNHPDFDLAGNFTWTFMYSGEEVTLTGPTPSFTFNEPGDYLVRLNVSDPSGVWDTDTVAIGVRDTEDPVADAGPDITVDQGVPVLLDGTMSSDNHPDFPDGFTFEWFFIDQKVVRLNGITVEHTFNSPGIYTVRLTVTDLADNTDDDTMTVTVRDVEPPVADAGPDIVVDDKQLVNFDGTNSSDNFEIVRMVWEFYLGDDPVNLTGRAPKYTFPAPGVYNVTLTVYDADGQMDTDSMTVTVLDVTPPIADAGEVREFNEDVEVTMDASLSFDDVGIVSYEWVVTYDGGTVFEGDSVKETYMFTEPGLYEITLTVTDGVGLVASDTVQYSVVDVTPPTADAGDNLQIDEDVPHTFSGSGSEDNVGIVEWEWMITAEGMPPVRRTGEEFEYVFSEPEVYTVTLTVYDREGKFDSDSVQVTVLDVTPPVVVPPESLEIKKGQVVELDGRQSTDNVGIVKYHWHYEMAGAPFDRFGPNITQEFDAKGNYTITLTVEDAAGNMDTKDFYVLVKDPPKEEEPGFGLLIALVAVTAAAAAITASRRR